MIAQTISLASLVAAKHDALAALDALTQAAPFEPVASVSYLSSGRLLVLADSASDAVLEQVASALDGVLSVAVFAQTPQMTSSPAGIETRVGELVSVQGYLGNFELQWRRAAAAQTEAASFDLVLDLKTQPVFTMSQPPQGYFHAPAERPDALAAALTELPAMVGEFEKPKFFAYKESICAHSRSQKRGCNRCIDICSTKAISPAGDIVAIDPHLCMGCGACATVCPSGAMSYQYPRVVDRGAQLRAMFGAYRGVVPAAAPIVLFHQDATDVPAMSEPAHEAQLLPLNAWHIAAIGLDLLLGLVAYGARGAVILSNGNEERAYLDALQREMATAETLLRALGYAGQHFALCDATTLPAAVANIAAATTVTATATFHLGNDKRGTIEFAIEHLAKHAPTVPEAIALTAPAMFGTLAVDKDKCTMCLACAGACPESALMDGGELPQLKFLERNCVQCGLCVNTCPETAITLVPRLLLTPQRKQSVVLNETEPFDCISCGKPLGTKKLIDTMMGKLAGHSMFQGEGALKRLQMCADCRVVDMMSNKHEMSILTGKPIE
jgi:ferredoxin